MFIIQAADGKEYGPVTTGHIAEWIRDGRANLLTKARRNSESVWKPLGNFEEFRVGPDATAAAPVSPAVLSAAPEPGAGTALSSASLWLRLPAALIDGLLRIICFLPTTVPVTRAMLDLLKDDQMHSLSDAATIMRGVINANLDKSLPFLAVLLLAQLALLTVRGQSIGKLLLGLRIVRVDGSAPGFQHAFMLRSALPFMLEQVPVLGLGFWIVDSGFIFRADRRCVHDLFADTRVVKGS